MAGYGTGFGYVVFKGTRYDHDVVVVNGDVARRRKELSSRYRAAYGHTPLSAEELREYLSGVEVKVLIIGTGQYGALPMTPEARQLVEDLKRRGVKVIKAATPEALKHYASLESEEGVVAVLHVTC